MVTVRFQEYRFNIIDFMNLASTAARQLNHEEYGIGSIDNPNVRAMGERASLDSDTLPQLLLYFNVRTKAFGWRCKITDSEVTYSPKLGLHSPDLFKIYDICNRVPHSIDESGAVYTDGSLTVLLRPKGYIVWSFDGGLELPEGRNRMLRKVKGETLSRQECQTIFETLEGNTDDF